MAGKRRRPRKRAWARPPAVDPAPFRPSISPNRPTPARSTAIEEGGGVGPAFARGRWQPGEERRRIELPTGSAGRVAGAVDAASAGATIGQAGTGKPARFPGSVPAPAGAGQSTRTPAPGRASSQPAGAPSTPILWQPHALHTSSKERALARHVRPPAPIEPPIMANATHPFGRQDARLSRSRCQVRQQHFVRHSSASRVEGTHARRPRARRSFRASRKWVGRPSA